MNLRDAYEKVLINEGILDRMKAKAGTRLTSLGGKVLGSIEKHTVGELSKTAGKLRKSAEKDIQEKRLKNMSKILYSKLVNVYNEFNEDLQELGFDVEGLKLKARNEVNRGIVLALNKYKELLNILSSIK